MLLLKFKNYSFFKVKGILLIYAAYSNFWVPYNSSSQDSNNHYRYCFNFFYLLLLSIAVAHVYEDQALHPDCIYLNLYHFCWAIISTCQWADCCLDNSTTKLWFKSVTMPLPWVLSINLGDLLGVSMAKETLQCLTLYLLQNCCV